MENNEEYTNECGVCPKCKETTLYYGTIECEDELVYYPYECLNCGLKGREYYELQFNGHMIKTDKGEYIEL